MLRTLGEDLQGWLQGLTLNSSPHSGHAFLVNSPNRLSENSPAWQHTQKCVLFVSCGVIGGVMAVSTVSSAFFCPCRRPYKVRLPALLASCVFHHGVRSCLFFKAWKLTTDHAGKLRGEPLFALAVETPLFALRYSRPAWPALLALPPRYGTRSPDEAHI